MCLTIHCLFCGPHWSYSFPRVSTVKGVRELIHSGEPDLRTICRPPKAAREQQTADSHRPSEPPIDFNCERRSFLDTTTAIPPGGRAAPQLPSRETRDAPPLPVKPSSRHFANADTICINIQILCLKRDCEPTIKATMTRIAALDSS